MKIVILNGNPDLKKPTFDDYVNTLAENLISGGHSVSSLTLRDLEAGYCTGCWSCWVKTPGRCIFKDDSHLVCEKVINADLVLFASPVIMGYLSAELKKYMDKMIPLLHPYLDVDQCEAHHRHRYAPSDYPLSALLLEKTPGTDDEDIAIIEAIHARTALNMKSRNAFTMQTSQSVEEVTNAINRL